MSLFEYAQEVVSRKLEREKPVLSVSMGMQPVMPMAQGGGLSSVQNSLNINGQPHRLAYINPNEEDLLKSLGGSGRKIDGIPAYMMAGDDEGGHGYGGYSGSNTGDDIGFDALTGITTSPSEEGLSTVGAPAGGNPDTFDVPDLGVPAQNPDTFDPSLPNPSLETTLDFYNRENLNRKDYAPRGFLENINPLQLIFSPLATLAKAGITTAINNNFGMDPMGVVGNVGHAPSEGINDDNEGYGGGDDYIIKKKIAEVKQIPIEKVTAEEVERAKRLTYAQRVAGTRLEDILDDIYGSGQGAGMLGFNSDNANEGTA
jgi:hypothetical protein